MPVKKLKRFLDEKKIKYVSIKHSLAYTAQEIAASAHIHGREVAKTVIVKLDDKLAMAVVSANDKVDLKLLKNASGAKTVELASEDEFHDLFPDCALGAMPPFGNLYGMEVFIDKGLIDKMEITFNAGSHTELIRLSYSDFERLVKPKVTVLSKS